MSSEIDIKLEILKLEKENQEKLKKEGYKQISNGKGYVVLSKNEKPSQSVSSLNNPNDLFDYGKAQTVNTNFTIDRNIMMKVPPDPLVFIKIPTSKIVQSKVSLNLEGSCHVDLPCNVVPCAAFMRYIRSYPIVGQVVETLEKKKGFTSRFNVSVDVKAGVSAGFLGCEASLEVTTGFEYGETVTSETTETWTQTLNEGTYIVFQNVLVYAYVITLQEQYLEAFNIWNPGLNMRYVPDLKACVIFVPINRDDPFTLHYQDATWDPVEYDSLIEYLFANPSKWRSD
ncbi:hypothetical protein ACTFIW_005582 [Dictyostelium discoideum]